VEALRKKERQDETQFTTKIGGGAHEKKKDRMKLSLQPKLVDLLIINSGFWCCVFLTLRITLLSLGSGYLKKTWEFYISNQIPSWNIVSIGWIGKNVPKFGWSLIFKIHPLLDRDELKLHLLHSEFSWAKLFAKWKKN